tara:strand:+ start:1843 stop:3228 length:1386 start_codon:yes stop_codon:yes gene_type:complete
MSKIFPGIKVSMGSWSYTTIRVKFNDLKHTFAFQKYLDPDNADSLDSRLNREVNTGRVSRDMSDYLVRKPDRFYSTIVVANLKENALNWKDVDEKTLPEGIEPEVDRLGYLTFNEDDRYYILDGQHRVASIINIIEAEGIDPPDGFGDEEITVNVINREEGISQSEMIVSYRRLFTSLNRNAKPTSKAVNIILDEDDPFALVSRYLIKNFEPFSSIGFDADDNPNIQIEPKNLNARNAENGSLKVFTSLETLYGMNIKLLNSPKFEELNPASKEEFKFRPNDRDLESYQDEALKIWEAIFQVLPEIGGDRTKMRRHNASIENDELSDHVYLWPLIQEGILAPLVRQLLDNAGVDSEKTYAEILEPLSKVELDFRKPPWNPLILAPKDPSDSESALNIVSERRAFIVDKVMLPLMKYLVGAIEMNEDDIEEMRKKVKTDTRKVFTNVDLFDEYWSSVLDQKV